MDLCALGEAIAGALQWRVGDSDNEPERRNPRAEREGGTAQPSFHCRTAMATAASTGDIAATAPGDPTRRQNMVTGSSPPSTLIQDHSGREPQKKFILEGFHMDVTDSDVGALSGRSFSISMFSEGCHAAVPLAP